MSILTKFLILTLTVLTLYSQELLCTVNVRAPSVQGIDKSVFQQMQRDIYQFMNNNKWTQHKFKQQEKIKCSLTIIINNVPTPDRFEGTMQVQVRRPVYNSTYETLTLNFIDKNFAINYVPFQTLRFTTTTYENNLVSILTFWGYMILGFDYDSFGKAAGVPFFQTAREILNLAQDSGERGWRAMDGTYTRYWLVENMLNDSYKEIHNVYYKYHREGLDIMAEDVNLGRENILAALKILQRLFLSNPNIIVANTFIDAKSNELVNIFKNADPAQKTQFLALMRSLDPANMNRYEKIKEK